MRALAAGVAAAVLAAAPAASGAAGPALLTGVHVGASSVRFDFRSAPLRVRARFVARASLTECGSGKRVPLRGAAYVVVHFTPAMTARVSGSKVTRTYTGPSRLSGRESVREVAKVCDFEADVGWAVGLARHLPLHVVRAGASVILRFG